MKYIKQFNNEAAYNTAKSGNDFILPSVSLLKAEYEVRYDNIVPGPTPVDPTDYSYLTFTKIANGEASIELNESYESTFYEDIQSLLVIPESVLLNNEVLSIVDIPNGSYEEGGSEVTASLCACYHRSIYLPRSLTNIGMYAFADLFVKHGYPDYETEPVSVYIPNSVTNIGRYAFNNIGNNLEVNIYCEAASKPAGWHTDWIYIDQQWDGYANVYWGQTLPY